MVSGKGRGGWKETLSPVDGGWWMVDGGLVDGRWMGMGIYDWGVGVGFVGGWWLWICVWVDMK